MPAHSKNLTERTSLRFTTFERAILAKVVRAHADLGIKISLNDAIRICIRRAAAPLPSDVPSARRAIENHLRDCEHCTETAIRCPDGWALNDAYGRVSGQQAPSRPPEPTATPERRTITGRRPLLPPAPGRKAG